MECKVYVSVTTQFYQDGRIIPLSFLWEDGTAYQVDQILDIRRAASLKAGGTGIRYTVMVQGQKCHLYFEDPKWFMERKR